MAEEQGCQGGVDFSAVAETSRDICAEEPSVRIAIECGDCELSVHELLQLAEGINLELPIAEADEVWISIAGERIAKGQIMVRESHYLVRVTDIVQDKPRPLSIYSR